MTYKTIHTRNGLVAMVQAEATGTPISITHMAVGDGNGNPVTPTEPQTVPISSSTKSGSPKATNPNLRTLHL